jgi:hypothetical protein
VRANAKWGIEVSLRERLFYKIMVFLKAVLKQFGVKP